MTCYAYHRVRKAYQISPGWVEDYQQEMIHNHSISKENIIIEYQSPTEIMYHPKGLMNLIDYILTPNDLLMIDELEDLGNSTCQIADTLSRCHELMIPVVFTSSSNKNIFDIKLNLHETIVMLSKIDESLKNRKKIKRCHIAIRNGNLLGRPNGSKYNNLIQKLKSQGYKQKEVAEILDISISTVKRYWNKTIIE